MRTLIITLASAFVFLLAQQLTAASRGFHPQERGASQAVIAGSIKCATSPEVNSTGLVIVGGLGVLAIPTTAPTQVGGVQLPLSFTHHAEDCLDLIPALAEQVPHRICEVGNPFESGNILEVSFVCTGRADAVISAVGKIAKAVTAIGQS